MTVSCFELEVYHDRLFDCNELIEKTSFRKVWKRNAMTTEGNDLRIHGSPFLCFGACRRRHSLGGGRLACTRVEVVKEGG